MPQLGHPCHAALLQYQVKIVSSNLAIMATISPEWCPERWPFLDIQVVIVSRSCCLVLDAYNCCRKWLLRSLVNSAL
jgi:hypothetical protein